MRGRQIFMETLIAHGVRHIFGNPGTTESPLLDSLTEYPDITYIMTLHEGIAVGAASHYAQASGTTPVVNLHVAPGLGNAIGMMYNALKARSPLLVTAGQQDTRMRLSEPVLGHDLAAMAAPVCKWSVQAESADELPQILKRAFKIAETAPAGPVFVALPINVLEQETTAAPARPDGLYSAGPAHSDGIAALAKRLIAAERPMIVAGDAIAASGATDALVTLAETLGADVWHELLHMQAAFPSHHACARGPLPADAMGIAKSLAEADIVLMLGGAFFDDVWFAPGGHFPEGCTVAQIDDCLDNLARKQAVDIGLVGDLPDTIKAVTAAIVADRDDSQAQIAASRLLERQTRKEADIAGQKARATRSWDRRPTSMARAMAEIASAATPETIFVDETITASIDFARSIDISGPGSYFGSRGGGIGQGLAGALGVKIAEPDRPVLCLSGDGSAMYSIQALWTAAHHNIAVTFIILANREYRVLKHNLDAYRQRFDAASNHPYNHMDLTAPVLDFVSIAQGMGITAARIDDPGEIGSALTSALTSGAPRLLEIVIEGKA